MTDESDLLQAIARAPDDDAPRLIYADWLDDRGDGPRAEFIRTQIELATIDNLHPRFVELTTREHALLRRFTDAWKIQGVKARQEFRRGFIEHVWIRNDRLKSASPFLEPHPLVRSLRISGVNPRAGLPRDIAWFDRITDLDLTNNSMVRILLVRLLLDRPLPLLRSLTLQNVRLWPDDLIWLGESELAPGLERLNLSGNPLGDEGVEVLVDQKWPRLTSLAMRSDGIDMGDSIREAGFEALARSKLLTKLQALDLTGHRPGAALVEFLSCERFPRLERLGLSLRGEDLPVAWHDWLNGFNPPRLTSWSLAGAITNDATIALIDWLIQRPETRLDLAKATMDEATIAIWEASLVRDRVRLPRVTE